MRYLVIALFVLIFASLGSALVFLVKDKGGDSTRTVRALTWRIGLSVAVFLLIMLSYQMGWIHGRLGG